MFSRSYRRLVPSPWPSSRAIKRNPAGVFESSVGSVIADMRMHLGETLNIDELYVNYRINRRRMYDVVNVLAAVGFCDRVGSDTIRCTGISGAEKRLIQLKNTYRLDNERLSVEHMFPTDCCVSLTTLAVAFMLIFPALSMQEVDLHDVSEFLARGTARHKTTMCKLYQISLILRLTGILEKSAESCIVRMNQRLFDVGTGKTVPNDPLYSISIEFLLAGATPQGLPSHIVARRKEYIRVARALRSPK